MSPSSPPRQRTATSRFGRTYHVYETPEGEVLPSVTTILNVIGKPALINWAANQERELVLEAAMHLWEDVPTAPKMSATTFRATLLQRLGKEKAHQKALAKAGEIGSETHALIEWNLRRELGQECGPQPRVCEKAAWAFGCYERWRATCELAPSFIEQTVWSSEHRYAGTMDVFGQMRTPEGIAPVVLDWKTGKAVYLEAKLQNAAYREALIEMGHATEDAWGAVVRLPKVESDPDPEVVLISPEECRRHFSAFLAAKQLYEHMQREVEK